MHVYDDIINSSIEIIRNLPIDVPAYGRLAGFIKAECDLKHAENFTKGDNLHFPLGDTYLTLGIKGISDMAVKKAEAATDEYAKALMYGISTVYNELSLYYKRYALNIKKNAEKECLPEAESARLYRISENLLYLSESKPANFEQAVQSVYFMWSIRSILNTSCIGRLDSALRTFFEKDISSGFIDEDEALEILCELWRRLNARGSGDTLVNITVGGCNPDGSDASSILTVLMLKASLIVRGTEPHVNVRYHKNIRKDVMDAALDLQALGHGQASIYNDDAVIKSLISAGIPEKWAYRYANDGCTEIMIDGGSMIDFAHIDAVATVELTLHNGRLFDRPCEEAVHYWTHKMPAEIYKPDVIEGYESGDILNCDNFEGVYDAFLKQYKYQVIEKCKILKEMYENRIKTYGSLFVSGTYDTVFESEKDFVRGGLPVECWQLFSGSVTTAADSLEAIKKVVFEEKYCTMKELMDALAANFEGYEILRRKLKNAPKFGNDIDDVDLLAADIVDRFLAWIKDFRKSTGFHVWPDLLGWRFVQEAYGSWATPDGRKWKDPIAEHYCATPGCAVNGPTALICSIGKANLQGAYGVAAVHVSLPRILSITEDEYKKHLLSLVLAAMQKNFIMINIAIYNIDELKDAQIHPENHEDLIVRVWGYCARFIDLSREMQDHIINRALK